MKNIAILAGDGIGPEVMVQAVRVLEKIAAKYKLKFTFSEALIGGAAYAKYQSHFPDETKNICKKADAILFGSVGGPIEQAHLPQWNNCEANSILALRKTFSLNANLRPAKIYSQLLDICPLQPSRLQNGVDILIVRELVGDIYFGEHKQSKNSDGRYATDVAEYTEEQITKVAHVAFKAAAARGGKLTSVDKANVLATSKLWREVVSEVASVYPQVKLEHMLVDNCAMQLFLAPSQFDVIVTANLFGDILSDAAAALPGSLGLMPSASLNEQGFGLYEPSGGSAPQLAGKNIANPVAQILSVAQMLQHSFNLHDAASNIEQAVEQTFAAGFCTQDLANNKRQVLGTAEFTDMVLEKL